MTEGSFPSAARRFEAVGFSEIVKVRNRVLELLAAGHKVWRFEGGEPYMPTPQPIKDAMTAALARNETRYAPSSGIPELRRAIVEKVRQKNGIPADDESPIVVNGGMHEVDDLRRGVELVSQLACGAAGEPACADNDVDVARQSVSP